MTVRWLVDKSALWRANQPEVNDVLQPRIVRGLVGVSIATELEIGFSAQSAQDYDLMNELVVTQLVPIPITVHVGDRARSLQRGLVIRGRHRAVSVPDLLIAATAQVEGLTVLHYDADFDMIAEITQQPMEWVVPRGSI